MSARTSKKVQRSEKKSNNVTEALISALRKGKNTGLYLAKITKVKGDGRFTVKNTNKNDHNVRLSKTLFSKGAKHRNSTMKIAVHAGSNVLVDGDLIRAVVGERDASELRSLLKTVAENNNNNIFNRGTRKANSNKSA